MKKQGKEEKHKAEKVARAHRSFVVDLTGTSARVTT